MKKSFLISIIFFNILLPKKHNFSLSADLGYSYISMKEINNSLKYLKEYTENNNYKIKLVPVHHAMGLGISGNISLSERIITGLRIEAISLLPGFVNDQKYNKVSVYGNVYPVLLNFNYILPYKHSKFRITAGAAGGIAYTKSYIEYSGLTYILPYEITGLGHILDLNSRITYHILKNTGIYFKIGIRECRINNLEASHTVELLGIKAGDKIKGFKGEDISFDLSGFTLSLGLVLTFSDK